MFFVCSILVVPVWYVWHCANMYPSTVNKILPLRFCLFDDMGHIIWVNAEYKFVFILYKIIKINYNHKNKFTIDYMGWILCNRAARLPSLCYRADTCILDLFQL